MGPSGYSIEITNLSPNATEKDVYDFFAFCGAIQHIEIVRAEEYACKAYVIFRNPHAVETAVILDGTTILDQPVCITERGHYGDDYNCSNPFSWKIEDESDSKNSAGKAVSMAQDVVKTMAAKGYVLGKEAFGKAKAFDESHHVSSKVAELSQGIGLTNKISAGVEAAKSMDQKYRISGTTKSAVCATRSTAVSAANAVVKSSYFSKGAFWLSGALNRASQVAADLSSRGVSK